MSFLYQTRMHSIRMRTSCSLPYRGGGEGVGALSGEVSIQGVSVQEGLCPGVGLCPEGSLYGGSLYGGSLSRGVSIQGGLCPGGSLSRGVWGVCLWGLLGFSLTETPSPYGQKNVTGPLGLWMFERPGELQLNHSNVNFNYIY